jgi:hypothetical protein
MTIEFNHTIVPSHDQSAAARDLADLLGLEVSTLGHFDAVRIGNGVSLDFMNVPELPSMPMHLAFLVDEDTFDEVFGRIQASDRPYWSDPIRTKPGEINHSRGGRGVYWDSLEGHNCEILTRSA